jgi:hypothetical protein
MSKTPKRPRLTQESHGTGALAAAGAAAAPENSLDTRAGLVLLASAQTLPVAHAFESSRLVVGRADDCQLRIPELAVSQRHASIEFEDGAWILTDLGSSNGTFVDGKRIQRAPLLSSSLVLIGNTAFKFVRAGIESYANYDIYGVYQGLPSARDDTLPIGRLVGGYQVHCVARVLYRLAPGPVTVVIAGEEGTERESCALQLHEWSRKTRGFFGMPCADQTAMALGLKLAGRLVEVAGGTVFIDGADRLSPSEVVGLERILATASDASGAAGARLVLGVGTGWAAAPSDAHAYGVTLPPLRERKEDVHGLCRSHLANLGLSSVGIDFKFLLGLLHHDFPGNIDELQRIIDSSLAGSEGPSLRKEHLPRLLRVRMAEIFRAQRS